jgi:hypothetical protein
MICNLAGRCWPHAKQAKNFGPNVTVDEPEYGGSARPGCASRFLLMPNERKDLHLDGDRLTLEDRGRSDRAEFAVPESALSFRAEAKGAAEARPGIPISASTGEADFGDPIRGIAIGIAMAAPFWILVALGFLIFVIPGLR